jgi:hypothetical protein
MIRRWVGVALVAVAAPGLAGCAITMHRAPLLSLSAPRPAERGSRGEPQLVGVGVTGGRRLGFDSVPAPRRSGDSVYASVAGAPFIVTWRLVREIAMAGPAGTGLWVKTRDVRRARDEVMKQRFVGLRTREGGDVSFDRGTLRYVAADTAYGTVAGAPYRIPVSQVEGFRVVRTDVPMSVVASVLATGVLIGIGVGTVVAILVASGWTLP